MIRDVLVHVDPSPSGGERLKYALALAERHSARLIGVHVVAPVDVPPYFRPSSVEREAILLEQQARENAAAARSLFQEKTAEQRVLVEWRDLTGDMKHELTAQAAFADIVVVGQYEAEGTPERHPLYLAEELVLSCGRPVLVVPEKPANFIRLRRALIGWDAGREAVRAVHDAISLLVTAGAAVEILVADENGASVPTADLVGHLGRHGITVDPTRHLHRKEATADALTRRLAAGEFDLLVMGAYGHPAWLEFLLGGTTRSALMRATAPVLVSH
jgi:nucleotide-binding universal stress UspA family protein